MGPSRAARPQKAVTDTRQQKKPYSRPPTSSRRLQCYNCGRDHLRRDCTRPASSTGGGSSTGKCYVCDQTTHFARQCPNRKPTGGAPIR